MEREAGVLFHDNVDAGTAGERWDLVSGRPYVETETDAKVARGRQSARFVVKGDRRYRWWSGRRCQREG
jgi:hypothetical protein